MPRSRQVDLRCHRAAKQYNLGTIGNSIAGLIGGGVGAQIIGALVGGETGPAWLEPAGASILARLSVRSPPAVSAEASSYILATDRRHKTVRRDHRYPARPAQNSRRRSPASDPRSTVADARGQ
jgi:hypothetical protein